MQAHGFNSEVEARLRDALFGTALTGIEATGRAYPLGAFLLVGAMLDMLAGLMHAPARDNDGQQGVRYAAFIERFFGERCRTLKIEIPGLSFPVRFPPHSVASQAHMAGRRSDLVPERATTRSSFSQLDSRAQGPSGGRAPMS